jgi:hypothetical protein
VGLNRLSGMGDAARGFVNKHRTAAGIAAAAVAAVAVWKAAAAFGVLGSPVAPSASAVRPPAASAPTARPTPATAQHAPAAAGATATGVQAPTAEAPSPAAASGGGRPDPFSPLESVTPGAAAHPSLPPVPSLPPGAGQDAAVPPPGPGGNDLAPAQARFHLVGIVNADTPVAILNDDAASYIVQPGDTVAPAVRLVAVDAEMRRVTLAYNDQLWQLSLTEGGTSR